MRIPSSSIPFAAGTSVPPASPKPNAAPIIKPSGLSNVGYKLGKGFFELAPKFNKWVDRTFVYSAQNIKPNWLMRQAGGALKLTVGNLLNQELYKVSNLGPLGLVAVNGTPGLLMVLYFGFVIGGRLWHAARRAETMPNGKMDRREARDILCRDIPSLALLIFALDPSIKKLCGWLQKRRGIELLETVDAGKGIKELMTYSKMDKAFHVGDPNRLVALMENPNNHKGLLRAIDVLRDDQSLAAKTRRLLGLKTRPNPEISDAAHQLLNEFHAEIVKGCDLVDKAGKAGHPVQSSQLEAIAKQGFSKLEKLCVGRDEAIKAIEAQEAKGMSKKLVTQLAAKAERRMPYYTDMFAKYAQRTRIIADSAALATCVAAIGVGVTTFNWWYTEREFKKLLKQREADGAKRLHQRETTQPQPEQPQPPTVNPFYNPGALSPAARTALAWPAPMNPWGAYAPASTAIPYAGPGVSA